MFSKKIYALTHFNIKAAELINSMNQHGYNIEILDQVAGFGDLVIEDGSVLIDFRYADGLEVDEKNVLGGVQPNYVLVVLNDKYLRPRVESNANIHYIGHQNAFRQEFVIQKLDEMLPLWVEGFKMVEAQVELDTNKS